MSTSALLRGKVTVPTLASHFGRRARLDALIGGLVERHRVVALVATAGSGKTSAVVSATSGGSRPVAWLSADRWDVAPGRLVAYLEAAVAQRLPALAGTATVALSAGVSHAEAAAVLAEAIGDLDLLVVLDDLERVGEDAAAWAVIESFIRYCPATVRVILLSRRELPSELCALPVEAAASRVGETELAFTTAEAFEALARAGRSEIDAEAAVEATGGWVTGVLFEAWKSAEHIARSGGESDPLFGYLSSQVLGSLTEADRGFLITTSLLDVVDVAGAGALGIESAAERLAALRTAHLPVSWSADGRELRCHSRLREYLFMLLEQEGEERFGALQLANARRLARTDKEQATEEFLRAGALEEASACAEGCIVGVVERADFALAQRWLDQLDGHAPVRASNCTIARLMLATARFDIGEVVRLSDLLATQGDRNELAARSETAMWLMAWSYMHVMRTSDTFALVAAAPPSPAADAMRYATRAMGNFPANGVPRPSPTGDPIDSLIYIADYALGRLPELTEAPANGWEEAIKGHWRIEALRATGQTERALAMLEQKLESAADLPLTIYIAAEVLIDAGQAARARAMIEKGRIAAHASGSLALQGMNSLMEAKLLLRLENDHDAAITIMQQPHCVQFATGMSMFAEISDMWCGLALLRRGEDAAALDRLAESVTGMVRGDRILELPVAAVYLAEAQWRAGNEQAADKAADLALATATRQGSRHTLLQALSDFPDVLTRRLDAEADDFSPWHDVGRALLAHGGTSNVTARPVVELRDFGQPRILINGEQHRPRIAKTYELLAYLASRRKPAATRQELLDALFDARTDDSTRAYLRQAIHWLRKTLPEGAVGDRDGGICLTDATAISSDSVRFETMLREASRLADEQRMPATLHALSMFESGPYLEGVQSAWAQQRSRALTTLAADARYEATRCAFAAGDYTLARNLISQIHTTDPHHEAAWQLQMRIANIFGDQNGVVRAYRGCEEALATIGATPCPTTRELFARFRA